MAFNYTICGDKPSDVYTSFSTAKAFYPPLISWGNANLFQTYSLQARADLNKKVASEIIYIDGAPEHSYRLKGRLTVRFFSHAEWMKSSDQIIERPLNFLCISGDPSMEFPLKPAHFIQPRKPEILTLEESMLEMLKQADPEALDVCKFIVGPSNVEIHAHLSMVKATVPVPWFREGGMKEGNTREVSLPDIDPDVFNVFLIFVYTKTVSDINLNKHAENLLVLSDRLQVPVLRYKCEYFLCWKVQVRRIIFFVQAIAISNHRMPQNFKPKVDIFALLTLADDHNAKNLKQACFQSIFLHGQGLLELKEYESLSHTLIIEMTREFAERRLSYMPPPDPEPPVPSTQPVVVKPDAQKGGAAAAKRKKPETPP
jgi:hypothetical protein